jgi:hypothetical protein
MTKIGAVLDALRFGGVVADKKNWVTKNGLAAAVAGLVLCATPFVKGTPVEAVINPQFADAIAYIVIAVAGLFVGAGVSDKVGVLPAKPEATPAAQSDVPNPGDREAP